MFSYNHALAACGSNDSLIILNDQIESGKELSYFITKANDINSKNLRASMLDALLIAPFPLNA